MPEEKLEAAKQVEKDIVPAELESSTTEIENKKNKLKKIEHLMKQFIATGVAMVAIVSAVELGGRAMGIKPEGQKIKLEKVEDIEYRGGVLKAEDIKAFLDTMPANWAYGEISAIEGLEKSDNDKAEFNVLAVYKPGNFKIQFDKSDTRELSKGEVMDILSHEIAHANDFSSDNELSTAEKDVLRDKLKERLAAPDRYMSPYVEKLIIDGVSSFTVKKEYWAEICRVYMMDPTVLNVEEFNLVQDYVKKNDPNYNWKDSIQKRWDLAYGK